MRRSLVIALLCILAILVAGAGVYLLSIPSEGRLNRKRQAYVEQHPELAPDVRQAILDGNLVEGMTFAEVQASVVTDGLGLGKRLTFYKKMAGAQGEIEIWADHRDWMLGFRDGILRTMDQMSTRPGAVRAKVDD